MKFYYLREFSVENGFNKLSILDRLILSVILTKRINKDDRDYVEIIMNFDGAQDYTAYSNWINYKDFVVAITDFINRENGHISDYILKHYDDKDEKDFRKLHYVSFDYSDLDITHKNAMSTIACKAFILAAANHAANDNNDWFSFNICQWKKTAMSQKKRSLEEIDNFMNKHNISYKLNGNKITVLNKKKQIKEKNEKADKDFKEQSPYKQEVKETVIEKPINVNCEIEDCKDVFNLGDRRLTLKDFQEYSKKHIINPVPPNHLAGNKYYTATINLLSHLQKEKEKDTAELLAKGYISGNDWKNRKKEANIKIHNLQNTVINFLNKLYDKDYNQYKLINTALLKNKIMLFETGLI